MLEVEHRVNLGFQEGARGEGERDVVVATEAADLFNYVGGDMNIGAPNRGGDAQRGVFWGFFRGARWDGGLIRGGLQRGCTHVKTDVLEGFGDFRGGIGGAEQLIEVLNGEFNQFRSGRTRVVIHYGQWLDA